MRSTRTEVAARPVYRFGSAEFDELRFELKVQGRVVQVQRKPLEVLALLLKRGDGVVTQDELMHQIWDDAPLVDNVLTNAVHKLRQALGKDNAQQVLTLHGVGYRLAQPAQREWVGLSIAGGQKLHPGASVAGRPGCQLQAPLRQGVHADVWLAREALSGVVSVLKFAHDEVGLARLRHEAALLTQLSGSKGLRLNIAPHLGSQLAGPAPYLEMEDGGLPLASWAQQPTVTDDGVRLALFLQICDAVAALHDVGLVHRELKPGHILVQAMGSVPKLQVRLIDFGASLSVRAGAVVTSASHANLPLVPDPVLTPPYSAPELLLGHAASAASDVFALGVLLAQLMRGEFRASLASGWERELTDPLLSEDIARATDAEPQRRFADAAALASALRALPQRRALLAQQAGARLRLGIQLAYGQLHELDAAVAAGHRALIAAEAIGSQADSMATQARLQLAYDLARTSKFSDCEALLHRVKLELAAAAPASLDEPWARWWWVQSNLLAYQLQLPQALAAAHQAMAHLRRCRHPEPQLADRIHMRLANAGRMLGDYVGSEQILRQLSDVQRARDGDDAECLHRSQVSLARSLMLQGRTDEAMVLAQTAAARLMQLLGEDNLVTQEAYDAVASVQFKAEQHADAARTWSCVVTSLRRTCLSPTDFLATAQSNLALSLLFAGQAAASEEAGQEAMALASGLLAADSPRLQSIRYHLAFSRLEQGKTQGVHELLAGLQPDALKQANQAEDWAGRLAYQRGRLALLQGHFEQARRMLLLAQEDLAMHVNLSPVNPAAVQRQLQRLLQLQSAP